MTEASLDEWITVHYEEDLEPGMFIRMRCSACSKIHIDILLEFGIDPKTRLLCWNIFPVINPDNCRDVRLVYSYHEAINTNVLQCANTGVLSIKEMRNGASLYYP